MSKDGVDASRPFSGVQTGLPGVDASRPFSEELDQWMTPDALAAKVAAWALDPLDRFVLEPSAGDGALVRAIRAQQPASRVTAVEIDAGLATQIPVIGGVPGVDDLQVRDFLTWTPDVRFDVCVMNPPFALAVEFIMHALRMCPRVVAVLPTTVVHTASRHETCWRHVGIPRLAFLSSRPRFRGAKNISPATDFIVAELVLLGRAGERASTQIEWWA